VHETHLICGPPCSKALQSTWTILYRPVLACTTRNPPSPALDLEFSGFGIFSCPKTNHPGFTDTAVIEIHCFGVFPPPWGQVVTGPLPCQHRSSQTPSPAPQASIFLLEISHPRLFLRALSCSERSALHFSALVLQ